MSYGCWVRCSNYYEAQFVFIYLSCMAGFRSVSMYHNQALQWLAVVKIPFEIYGINNEIEEDEKIENNGNC